MAEVKKEIQLEIGHVLFVDIVGYSKLSINEQRASLDTLNRMIRSTDEFRSAETAGRLIKIPTGDGMALVFYNSPESPVECALGISRALKEHPQLQLRMGVHSGPVSGVVDVSERGNVAGAGINLAQRVMDCVMRDTSYFPNVSLKIWINMGIGNRTCTISANAESNTACASTLLIFTQRISAILNCQKSSNRSRSTARECVGRG